MAKNFNVLRAKMSPEAQALAETRTCQMAQEVPFFGSLNTSESVRDRLTRYECAVEIIGALIAIKSSLLVIEEAGDADVVRVHQLQEERRQLVHERRDLHPDDDVAIRHVYEDYAPIVRARLTN